MTCSVRSCNFRSLRAGDAKVLPSNPPRGRLYLWPTDAAVRDLQPARVATAFFSTATALWNSLSRPRFHRRRQPAFCCISRVRKTRYAKCGFATSRKDDSRAEVAAGCVLREPPEELPGSTARTLATRFQRSARRGLHFPKLAKKRVNLGKSEPPAGLRHTHTGGIRATRTWFAIESGKTRRIRATIEAQEECLIPK